MPISFLKLVNLVSCRNVEKYGMVPWRISCDLLSVWKMKRGKGRSSNCHWGAAWSCLKSPCRMTLYVVVGHVLVFMTNHPLFHTLCSDERTYSTLWRSTGGRSHWWFACVRVHGCPMGGWAASFSLARERTRVRFLGGISQSVMTSSWTTSWRCSVQWGKALDNAGGIIWLIPIHGRLLFWAQRSGCNSNGLSMGQRTNCQCHG
jgi:hypothetical protein